MIRRADASIEKRTRQVGKKVRRKEIEAEKSKKI